MRHEALQDIMKQFACMGKQSRAWGYQHGDLFLPQPLEASSHRCCSGGGHVDPYAIATDTQPWLELTTMITIVAASDSTFCPLCHVDLAAVGV